MDRFCLLAAACLAAALSALPSARADAQELYKWTDASGKVHYGDRAAAPENSRPLNVPAAPVRPQPDAAALSPRAPLPAGAAQKKSVPVDPSRVGPACKGLIDRIAAVPAGTNWKPLAREYNDACPGIAYECVEYRAKPQNNQCAWVERSGGTMLNKKIFE